MGFPTKAEREVCWNARDKFWDCMNSNNEQAELCKQFRKVYEKSCSDQWVKHFDRRYKYERFKSKMESKEWQDPLEKK